MESSPLAWILIISLLHTLSLAGDFTLGMDSETSCTKTHYYKAGDVFTASANGIVHDGRCPLTFIQSGMWGDETVEPCLSLCVKIVSYTMDSCNVKMAYHDGVNDYTPVLFDCHTFPPVMWCSSKNDLKVSVSETKDYRGKDYAITLEVKPFCGSLDDKTTDAGVVAIPNKEPNVMNKTALIVGAIVGTVSILFVFGWILYCYKKRRNEDEAMAADNYQQDRRYRSTTPNQQPNRYAPVGFHVPASSQSSSDHGVLDPYHLHKDPTHPADYTEVKCPFHDVISPQLSNQSHMAGGEPWYHMSPMGQGVQGNMPVPMQQSQPPQNQQSQYLMQNQVYNYPQFNSADTAPSDTRFVVYDFDYPAPVQRKYSGGKMSMSHARDSPVKDIERLRSRELQQRGMPQIDSTTTDHTSDNDDSSYSVTTEDEATTTDDQTSPVKGQMYNFNQPYGHGAMINRDPNVRFYNQPNSQPVHRNVNPADDRINIPVNEYNPYQNNEQNMLSNKNPGSGPNAIQGLPSNRVLESIGSRQPQLRVQETLEGLQPQSRVKDSKEGPQPQVPSPQVPAVPRNQAEKLTPVKTSAPKHEDLPWPHNPPPAYSQTDSGDSDGAQII